MDRRVLVETRGDVTNITIEQQMEPIGVPMSIIILVSRKEEKSVNRRITKEKSPFQRRNFSRFNSF